jgi:Cys-rich protein (TIGR01571 family)
MQFLYPRSVFLALLALIPVGNATSFMTHRLKAGINNKKAIMNTTKVMPVQRHDKMAGGGYNKGSPLYETQETRRQQGIVSNMNSPQISVPVPRPVAGEDLEDHRTLYWKIHGHPLTKEFWYRGLAYFFSTFIHFMLLALIWRKCLAPKFIPYSDVSEKDRAVGEVRDPLSFGFDYGMFSDDHCFDYHASIWLCACFCLPLRLAESYGKRPKPVVPGGFVPALLIVVCLFGLEMLTGGLSMLIFLGFAVWARQEMRKKYGMARNLTTLGQDCLCWCCCPCCSAIQEARQVDFVYPPDRDPGFSSQKPSPY